MHAKTVISLKNKTKSPRT